MGIGSVVGRVLGGPFWARLKDALFRPGIPSHELDAQLAELKQSLPLPVFWLIGKAQAGKTSVICALTGRSDAEIGNGFQACTRTARFYDFPDPASSFVRFLDTRGLGESHYDPGEDLAWCREQSHLLMAVVKAADHQLEMVLAPLREIRRQRPDWPLLVLQTCLHEAYPSRDFEHVQPYPYQQSPLPPSVPSDLGRSLLRQRESFAGLGARFVPVDFTLPENGYTPEFYGLEALWDAIEAVFPLGLRAMVQEGPQRQGLRDAYARRAHPHIVAYALSAGTAAAIPAPAASLSVVLAIQAKLFHSLAALYGQKLTVQRFTEFAGSLGLGYMAIQWGGREVFNEALKLIPGYGQTAGAAVAGVYAATVTFALGKTLCAYFETVNRGTIPAPGAFQRLYREELAAGRALVQRRLRTPGNPRH